MSGYTSDFWRKFYCPNDSCRGANGLTHCLLEIPVDASHVMIFCPYCQLEVVLCENCFCLLSAASVTKKLSSCPACGFIQRIVQRSISEAGYAHMKALELKNASAWVTNPTNNKAVIVSMSIVPEIGLTLQSNNEQSNTKRSTNKRQRPQESQSLSESPVERHSKRRKIDESSDSMPSLPHQDFVDNIFEISNGTVSVVAEKWASYLKITPQAYITSLESQIRAILDNQQRALDLLSAEATHFSVRARNFDSSCITMLKALYLDAEQDIITTINHAEELIWSQNNLLVAKWKTELTETAARRISVCPPVKLESGRADLKPEEFVGAVLNAKLQMQRAKLEQIAEANLGLLVSINKILKLLYDELKDKLIEAGSMTFPPTTSQLLLDVDGSSIVRELSSSRSLSELKTKIQLWRQLYEYISTIIL